MTGLVVITAPSTEPVTVAEIMRHCRIDEADQELAPTAVTVALMSPAAAGNLSVGAYRYRATFVTADGETEGGIISSAVSVADAGINGKVAVSGIPVGGSLVTSRKLYRTAANGSSYLLLATIANNTTTTYTDNITDASLGAGVPTSNTTSDPQLLLLAKAARVTAENKTRRAICTQTWDLKMDSFPGWAIHIPKPPLQSITHIKYIDNNGIEQTLGSGEYLVDTTSEPAQVTPVFGGAWPTPRWQNNAVTVRFVAGYGDAGDVPEGIKLWMMTRIKHHHANPAPLVVGTISSEFPRDYVDGLLDDFTVHGYQWAR